MSLSCCETFLIYFFNIFTMIVLLPVGLYTCFGFFVVHPMHFHIIMVFGKVLKVIDTPGIAWSPYCSNRSVITQKIITINMPTTTIPDSTGSPMNVGTLITYVITNPIDARFNVNHLQGYMMAQAKEVTKTICGKFRYKDSDPLQPSLLQDSHFIMNEM